MAHVTIADFITWMTSAKTPRVHKLLGSKHDDTDVLNPLPLEGDLVLADATPAWTRLAIGTVDEVLGTDGTTALWRSLSEAGIQAQDDVLDDLAALSVVADNEVIVGTGAGTYAHESGNTLRTSLGLTIGTDVQAFDIVLDDLAALSAVADNEIIVGTGAGTYAHESGATARTSLGLAIGTDVQAWDAFLDDIAALTDPDADRIPFWDDSAGAIVWLTVGSGLTITDTTLTAP